MSQHYDNVTKYITAENTEQFTELILGYKNVTILDNLATEQITLKSAETDSTLKVKFPDEVAILHNEIQTHDSQEPMHYRIAGYNGFLIREYRLNVYSSIVYLHPNAGRNDPGYYEYIGHGCEYKIKYRVIRLIEIDGQSILEAEVPSLLPLTPLMRPSQGMNPTRWLDKCVDTMYTADVDTDVKDILLASLGIFGSLVYDMQEIKQAFSKNFLYDFPLIQEFIEEGKERGLEQGLEQGLERGQIICVIDLILESISERFQSVPVHTLKPLLDEIDDLDRLKQLLKAVPKVQNVKEFEELLS